MPKVSVIIPTYNRSSLVKEAVESVLAQTFNDLEIIVVDDGSTDDTRSVIEVVGDPKIKYYYKENAGVSNARNFGIEHAKGQYIAFLDSDDCWPKDFLKLLVGKLEKDHKYEAAYTSVKILSANGEFLKSTEESLCKSGKITADLFKNAFIWVSATVLRTDALGDLRFEQSLKNAEDSDFLLRLTARTQFVYVPDIQICRRISKDSLSCLAGINCSRILSLERFYFKLEGKHLVPAKTAKIKLSRSYRRVAERHRKSGNKSAAKYLYKRAVNYYPWDVRFYFGLLKTLFMKKANDKLPDWQMPEPLPLPVGTKPEVFCSKN